MPDPYDQVGYSLSGNPLSRVNIRRDEKILGIGLRGESDVLVVTARPRISREMVEGRLFLRIAIDKAGDRPEPPANYTFIGQIRTEKRKRWAIYESSERLAPQQIEASE